MQHPHQEAHKWPVTPTQEGSNTFGFCEHLHSYTHIPVCVGGGVIQSAQTHTCTHTPLKTNVCDVPQPSKLDLNSTYLLKNEGMRP